MPSTPRFLLGFSDPAHGPGEYPFANYVKGVVSLAASTFAYPSILNAAGYPTSAPTGFDIAGTVYIPPSYGAGNLVIKWTGQGRCKLDRGAPGFTIIDGAGFVSGGVDFNMDVTGTDARVVFQRDAPVTGDGLTFRFPQTGTYSNMANLVICREDDEALVDAGGIFNPDFTAKLAELNPKILRPMGWCNPNEHNNHNRWAYRRQTAHLNYGTDRWEPALWAGTIGGTDTYTCSAPSGWGGLVDGAMVHGQCTNANTVTTPTLNVASSGAKTITLMTAGALSVGSISAAGLRTFVFDAALDKWLMHSGGLRTHVPLEVQVELANETGRDFWVNIPHLMDDASIASMAEYIRDNLDTDLNCYCEYSNEIWNYTFQQTHWADARGTAIGWTSSNTRNHHGWYNLRSKQMFDIFEANWAGRSLNTLHPVLAVQSAASRGATDATPKYRIEGFDVTLDANGLYTTVAQDIVTDYSQAPNRAIDQNNVVLSYANYTSGAQIRNFDANWNASMPEAMAAADHYDSGDSERMAAALQIMDYDLRRGTRGGVAGGETLESMLAKYVGWNDRAVSWGVPVILYEGGPEFAALSSSRCTAIGIDTAYATKFTNLIAAYKNHALFEQFVKDWFNEFMARTASRCGSWLILFPTSQWSTHTDLYDEDPFKSWDALVALNHAEMRRIA